VIVDDPFAAPSTESSVAADAPGSRARRLEKQIWRVASWLLFFGVTFLLWAAAAVSAGWDATAAISAVTVGTFQLVVGFELRQLSPRARPWAVALQLPLLPLFPIGTWVALRSLVSLLGEAGRVTLSPSYPVAEPEELERPTVLVPLLAAPLILLAFREFVSLMLPSPG
jgi:hypothetical protein